MILYHAPCCINSQRLRIAMTEHGLSWDSQLINITMGEQYHPEYLNINEHGTVPTFIIGDNKFTNTRDSIQYIYQHYRETAGDIKGNIKYDHTLCHDWMQRIAHFDSRLFIYGHLPRRKKKRALRLLEFKLDMLTKYMLDFPELENHYADKANDIDNLRACMISPSAVEKTEEYLLRMLDKAEEQLTKTPYLAGDHFSGADAMLVPLLCSVKKLKCGKWIKRRGALFDYFSRIKKRAAYQVAIASYERFLPSLKWKLATWWHMRRKKWSGRY